MRVDKCGYYMRWVPLFFAGVTAVLAKCGIKRTDSTVATAIRTVVVLLFSWLMVCLVTPPRAALTAKWEDVVFFDFIRPLYGCVLAVLFSGIAVGTHQSGYGG